MKHLSKFMVGGFVLLQFLQAAPQPGPDKGEATLDGTWELVAYRYGSTTRPSSMPKDRREIKLISGKHFVWVVYDLRKRKPINVGGGICVLQSGQYVEKLEFGDARTEGLVGRPQTFRVSINGDTWHQSGVLSSGLTIEETWQRVQ